MALLSFTLINLNVFNINSKCPIVRMVIYDLVLAEDIFSRWRVTLGHSSPDMVYRANSMLLRSLTGQ